jgi:hypothetical protein
MRRGIPGALVSTAQQKEPVIPVLQLQQQTGGVRAAQAGRPAAGPHRVLFFPSRAPCYKSDVSLTPIGTLYD